MTVTQHVAREPNRREATFRDVLRALLRQRLGADPGTLNFLYPYSRFFKSDGAQDSAINGWRDTLHDSTRGVTYVHVPFCPAHCTFCGFATTYGLGRDRALRYLDAVEREVALLTDSINFDNFNLDALFIGGGTPNFLKPDEFTRLVEAVRQIVTIRDTTEFSVEIYPSTALTIDILPVLPTLGVNRISLAVQDFNDDVLTRARRLYTASEALAVGHRLTTIGFEQTNIDLMVGIPGQTPANAAPNLDAIAELRPSHVTLNPFSNRSPSIPLRQPRFQHELIALEDIRRLYELYRAWLLSNGYRQINKTNFERRGQPEFRYEAMVRDSAPRLGMGLNALSFNGRTPYRNTYRMNEYEAATHLGSLPIASSYPLTVDDHARAAGFYAILGGEIDLAKFASRYGSLAALEEISNVLEEFALVQRIGSRMILTEEGLWNVGIVQRAFLPFEVLQAVVSNSEEARVS